jgi:hypothetical protein
MMMSSASRSLSPFRRGPKRIVSTSNGTARLAIRLMWLAAAITS